MTAERATGRDGTLYGLQYLRAFAALAVVFFHAAERSGYAFAIGAAGVDVFFVISGFIMWVIINRRPVSPARFLVDRVRRIVPVYWLATGAMVAGGLVGLFPNLVLTTEHVVASFLFVPERSPSSGEIWPVLVQGWTLNYEMFFYAVFAASLLVPSRLRLPAVAALFVLLVALGSLTESGDPLVATYTRPIILEFVAGMLIGQLWLSRRVPGAGVALGLIAVALAGFAAIAVLRLPFDERVCGPLACALVCGAAALDRDGTVRLFRLPALLGDASYSIYLWHTFAISVSAKAGGMLGLPPALVFTVSVLSGVLAGLCGYYLVERPLLRATKPPRVAAVPVPP